MFQLLKEESKEIESKVSSFSSCLYFVPLRVPYCAGQESAVCSTSAKPGIGDRSIEAHEVE
jgi:hypothetical protein